MNYFINENIFAFNSGTEHSQARRVKMLNQKGAKSKFVTRQYNRYLDRDRHNLDLELSQIINMYDFFQGTLLRKRQPQSLRTLPSLPMQSYHIESPSPNYSLVKQSGRQIARINVLPATIGLVGEILYNDRADNITLRENWDWRGFCSSVDRFMPNGQLSSRQFLNLDGEPVLEVTYMLVENQFQPTLWHLIKYQGRDYRFKTENELFIFFLNELGRLDSKANFISERRSMDIPVAQTVTANHKIAIVHEMHTPDVNNPLQGDLYQSYHPLFDVVGPRFDLILTATKAQKDDLNRRYPKLKFDVINDTTLFEADMILDQSNPRISNHLLWLGRISPEKNPAGALELLKQLRTRVPDATLEFMGYAQNAEYLEKFKNLIVQLGLGQVVFITPYGSQEQVRAALQRASLLISTSSSEGQGMQLIEGLAHGLPLVVVENHYTTQDDTIITDGENGLVIDLHQPQRWLPAISQILGDEDTWSRMHQQSYRKAHTFTAMASYQNWETIQAKLH